MEPNDVQYNVYIPASVRIAMRECVEVNWQWVVRNAIAAKLSELREHDEPKVSQDEPQ